MTPFLKVLNLVINEKSGNGADWNDKSSERISSSSFSFLSTFCFLLLEFFFSIGVTSESDSMISGESTEFVLLVLVVFCFFLDFVADFAADEADVAFFLLLVDPMCLFWSLSKGEVRSKGYRGIVFVY